MLQSTEIRQWILRLALPAAACLVAGCESYPFLYAGGSTGKDTVAGSVVSRTGGFAEILLSGRTFINGTGVTTVTYARGTNRTPIGIDFNGDGKVDAVAGYDQGQSGVVQILLSKGDLNTVEYTSLTLDSNGRWSKLSDVAVADIDGDGALDILVAAQDGIAYLRNPGRGRETVLRAWGADRPELEFLAGSTAFLTNDEVEAILSDILPPGTDLNDYDVTVDQGYTTLTTGDVDNDGDADVAATRRLKINMQPKENTNVPAISIVAGEIQVFLNPGGATNGENFSLLTVGRHERYAELDREGASAVMLFDLDQDGDLDIVSAAREDDNAQIAWFENPGFADFSDTQQWRQWRIGSLRDTYAIEIADLTGDGRPDVVATGSEQRQLVLFVQPASGARRDFDWDSYPIVTFQTFLPRDVKALDIDQDGRLELVVGGTEGAVRYFDAPSDPAKEWTGTVILNFDPVGDVGRIGFGDLDGDGDLDLLCVLNNVTEAGETADRLVWIRNDLR